MILFSTKNLERVKECEKKIDFVRDEYWKEVFELEEKHKERYFCNKELGKLDLVKNEKMLEVMKNDSQKLFQKLSNLLPKVQDLESNYAKN